MERHKALPQTFTPENLAVWFTENHIDKRIHTQEVPLTDETRHEHEIKITAHTGALYDLKDLVAKFKKAVENGTPWENKIRQPQTFIIPPTKGSKELEANRQFSDRILKQGYTTVDTELFGIPFEKRVIFFDIEGNEFESADMNPEQLAAHGQLFDKSEGENVSLAKHIEKDLKKKGMDVTVTVGRGAKDDSSPLEQG